jgi:hypothetical protein
MLVAPMQKMSPSGPFLPFVALQRDVGNAGMSGLKADIA